MRSMYALHCSLAVAIPAIQPRLRLSRTNRLRFALPGGQRKLGSTTRRACTELIRFLTKCADGSPCSNGRSIPSPTRAESGTVTHHTIRGMLPRCLISCAQSTTTFCPARIAKRRPNVLDLLKRRWTTKISFIFPDLRPSAQCPIPAKTG